MDKHAYLIMAHSQFTLLEKLILLLDFPNNDIFIHIDKKVIDFDFLRFEKLLRFSKIFFVKKRVDVRWGTETQVWAELELFKLAYANGPYLYYHFISGSDLPLKNQHEIRSFFQDKTTSFLYCKKDLTNWDKKRLSYFYNLFKNNRLENYSILIQQKLKINRNSFLKKKYPILGKGANWGNFTQDAVKILIKAEKDIRRFCFHTICSDEMYKQIVLINNNSSIYTEEDTDGIRYIDWSAGGNHPKTLTVEDINNWGNFLFARKFDENVDRQVIDYLFEKIYTENCNSLKERGIIA